MDHIVLCVTIVADSTRETCRTDFCKITRTRCCSEKLRPGRPDVLPALTLVIRKEEKLVLDNRSTKGGAELVVPEDRLFYRAICVISKGTFERRYALGHAIPILVGV